MFECIVENANGVINVIVSTYKEDETGLEHSIMVKKDLKFYCV